MQIYPKWKYHRTEDAQIVNDAGEEEVLGDGWADSPAEFAKPTLVNATEEEVDEILDSFEEQPERRRGRKRK